MRSASDRKRHLASPLRLGRLSWATATILVASVAGGAGTPGYAETAFRFDLAQASAPISGKLQGDPVAGQAAFERQCAICHTVDPGGANRYGPNLFGVSGRKAGTAPGYVYTRAFKSAASWNWEDGLLAAWISSPGRMVPGTGMTVFPGVAEKDRNNIVAYLDSITSTP